MLGKTWRFALVLLAPLLGLGRGLLDRLLPDSRLAGVRGMRDRLAGRLGRPIDTAARLYRAVRSYEFRDCRLIVEQDGNVHYLLLSAALQRRATRIAAFLSGGSIALLLVMAGISAALSFAKDRLERSHEEIYRALTETYDGARAQDSNLSQEEMLAIASSIRERDKEIRRFVDRSLVSVTDENLGLNEALRASGLTEKAIRAIQMNTPLGGNGEAVSVKASFAQVNALAKVIANNRSLRDVLDELPDHLPLTSPTLSSGYGLRVHPISGKTQFHTGLDLLPSADLLIHPAKAGKVVLASYGQELGNVVIVRHGGKIETLYGHMASISVREGDEVTERSVLGIVGNTGTATTGRHLHFEVSVGGYPVDPLKVIQAVENLHRIEERRGG
jgi:murein DD-endopeptidase MepM/ murein hydrolase activator NlpD